MGWEGRGGEGRGGGDRRLKTGPPGHPNPATPLGVSPLRNVKAPSVGAGDRLCVLPTFRRFSNAPYFITYS